jgi:hypothetical protein
MVLLDSRPPIRSPLSKPYRQARRPDARDWLGPVKPLLPGRQIEHFYQFPTSLLCGFT